MFCHITQNWRGRPLTDRVAVVELIEATSTKAGLKVECALDPRTYQEGIRISDAEMKRLDITGDAFHPEWNYTVRPRRPRAGARSALGRDHPSVGRPRLQHAATGRSSLVPALARLGETS